LVKDYPLTILHKSRRKIDVLYNATLFKMKKVKFRDICCKGYYGSKENGRRTSEVT